MPRRPAVPGLDRRQQILERALDVFAEEGFDGATTKVIAERADVTQGLIYFYFPSKEDLFAAACQHQVAAVVQRLSLDSAREAEAPTDVVVRRFVHRLIEALAEPRTISLMKVMMRTHLHSSLFVDDSWRQPVRAFAIQLVKGLRGYLDDQVRRGALPELDTDLAAQVMMSAISHIMIRRAMGDETVARYSQEQLANLMSAFFLYGLLGGTARAGQAPLAL